MAPMTNHKYLTAKHLAEELGSTSFEVNEALIASGLQTAERVGKNRHFTVTPEGEKAGGKQMNSAHGAFVSWDRNILNRLGHLRPEDPVLMELKKITKLLTCILGRIAEVNLAKEQENDDLQV